MLILVNALDCYSAVNVNFDDMFTFSIIDGCHNDTQVMLITLEVHDPKFTDSHFLALSWVPHNKVIYGELNCDYVIPKNKECPMFLEGLPQSFTGTLRIMTIKMEDVEAFEVVIQKPE
ncbi:Hypothetical_protein [Hexamita inflata]|uniref:Hypothetical_protein n=1 Tax=Hexamita inflata TaxID=28002 RepID=A0AA86N6G6_9EUKA|nr:Hypothetical protein HINF_LOCUS1298 [Hexamita inflata]